MDIRKFREKINIIDRKIVDLLEERVSVVMQIGHVKKKTGKNVFYPAREKQIIDRVMQSRRKFPEEALSNIYNQIFQVSRGLEEELRIAFFGLEGTYTHLAATKIFGADINYVPLKTISELFDAVVTGTVHYSVVPFENTTEGIVTHTIDMFNQYDVKIISEFTMRITHTLLSKEKNLKSIRKIYSHRQPLAQCRKWIEFNLPHAEVIETDSTAEAARIAARSKGAAAIGSETASKLYKLPILKASVQDLQDNFTRFLVIGRENDNAMTGHDKTSLLFTLKDEPGALYSILSYFVKAKINLSKIESRPYRGRPWEYFFFVDIAGHNDEERIKKVLDLVRNRTIDLKVLGSYPESGRTKTSGGDS